ncbi:MAG: efflux RND transporter permease subunit, partial [Eubacteriales bacterium]
MAVTHKIKNEIEKNKLPDGVNITYGGEYEESQEQAPNIIAALIIAIIIIFFIMICHFKKIATAVLLLACISLCILGTATGILIQGVDFSLTCTLGVISLMGILVRNGIIMIDYAEELRSVEKMSVKDAIYHSAKRRMRPIFLTSAAASMGVIPMILGGSSLWMPMGTVIFYGTILTMLFILTILPVAYWLIFSRSTEKRINRENFELQ